jgi:hypothetical protein
MKYFLIILFFIQSIKVGCQGLITDDSVQLKKGFYKDFYEFKYNKPSGHLSFTWLEFDYKSEKLKLHNAYAIQIDSSNYNELNECYGFCDGDTIYISTNRYEKNSLFFEKLTFLGRYSMYETLHPVHRKLSTVVIDLNTGEIAVLSNNKLKNIIKDDKELYNKYLKISKTVNDSSDDLYDNNQNNKESDISLADYIKEYSLKHKSELKIDSEDITTGEINIILTKTIEDSTFDIYYNRIIERFKNIRDVGKVELWKSSRFIGLKVNNNLSRNTKYLYKIGLWRYFDKNGKIEKEIMYDLRENIVFKNDY